MELLSRITGMSLLVVCASLGSSAAGEETELISPNAKVGGLFGYSVCGISNVDTDSVGDVVVGAPWEDSATNVPDAGRAYIFSGATGNVLHTLNSPNPEVDGGFGQSVSGVPNVDADGLEDVVVGAFSETVSAFSGAGRAYLFSSATGNTVQTLFSPAPEVDGGFGFSVSGIPGVNNIGGDVVVGALKEDSVSGVSDAGRAYIFSGATSLPLVSPNEAIGGEFGRAVSGVRDIDGDGREDVVVGAPGEYGATLVRSGRVHVFSSATGLLLATLVSPNEVADGEFGFAVAGIPDVNHDGFGDVLVGAPGEYGDTPARSGRAYVFSGKTGALLYTLASPNERSYGRFGNAVSGVPGLYDEGGCPPGAFLPCGDVIVGAPHENSGGHAHLFSGLTGCLLRTLVSPNEEALAAFGVAVSGIPSGNGDAWGDPVVGATGNVPTDTGRAYIFWGEDLGPRRCVIPAVSEWGMMGLTLLLLSAGSVVLMRRRVAHTEP